MVINSDPPVPILDEAFFPDGHPSTGPNALILPSTAKKNVKQSSQAPPAKPLSKRAQRAIAKQAEKTRVNNLLDQNKTVLKQSRLSPEKADLLALVQFVSSPKISNANFYAAYKRLKQNGVTLPPAVIFRARHLEQKEDKAAIDSDSDDTTLSPPPVVPVKPVVSEIVAPAISELVAEVVPAPEPAEKIVERSWTHLLERRPVSRSMDIESVRVTLPAYGMEQEIIDACLNNLVTIVTGGTGCGKSTQVPQFLFEAGFSFSAERGRTMMIGVTQPRRVAALAVAARVAEELGSEGRHVGYQVRHERSESGGECRVKFMTDGILMKIIQGDFLLRDFSVIVLDEVHERSANCDILLGILSRVILLRKQLFEQRAIDIPPLRLVLMSATLRLCDFLDNPRLFPVPPVQLNIDAKLFPVTIHFNKITPEDYLDETLRKIRQVHNRLPRGSILVFLNGREEIMEMYDALTSSGRRVKSKKDVNQQDSEEELSDDEEEDTAKDERNVSLSKRRKVDEMASSKSLDEEASFVLEGEETEAKALELEPIMPSSSSQGQIWQGSGEGSGKLRVVPLYANLSRNRQKLAFLPPRDDERVIVLATNIAETSLTLPNIRYVIDPGFSKQRIYSSSGGTSTFQVVQISKANADQRGGRAGRVGAGHCYRLYSSAVFQHEFQDFPPVSILAAPLDGVLVYLASLGIPTVKNFPFPSPPKAMAVKAAADRLVTLGVMRKDESELRLTKLGQSASKYPLMPRFGLVMARGIIAARNSKQYKLVPLAALAVAALSVGRDLFATDMKWHERMKILKCNVEPIDDLENLIFIILLIARASGKREELCDLVGVSYNKYMETVTLALQVVQICARGEDLSGEELRMAIGQMDVHNVDPKLIAEKFWARVELPNTNIREHLRFCVATGLLDRLAVRYQVLSPISQQKASTALSHAEYKRYKKAYRASELGRTDLAFIHPSSRLLGVRPWPSLLSYTSITKGGSKDSFYMNDIVCIDDPQGLRDILGNDNQSEILEEWFRTQS